MLEKIRALIEEKCGNDNWNYHVRIVVKYAVLLAKKLGADLEVTELGALLHDIAWVTSMDYDEKHEITGQPMAEKLLKEFDYPQEKIDRIKHIIASHRGSADIRPETLEARIVANADAMAHFDVFPWLLKIALKKHDNDLPKSLKWVEDKIERDWDKKITIPEAKEMVKVKYEAIKTVVGAMV